MTAVPAEREAEFERVWEIPKGPLGKARTVNNNFTGVVFLFASFAFFLIAGVDSVTLRTQLIVPEAKFLEAPHFNQLFTTHGTAMMFLFAVPMLEAIGIFILPMLLGARDMPYPRLSSFTIWSFIFGGALFYSSTLPDIVDRFLPENALPDLVPNVGWFAYPPLSSRPYSPGINTDFYLIGLGFAEFAAIAAAIEVIVTVLIFRAPGMSLDKMPLFAWGMLVMAVMVLVSFPALVVATTMLELERKFGIPFFDPTRGGDPLLWQHLFWFFGHPEVYIMFIPAAGIVSMVVATFAGRPVAGYAFLAAAAVGTGFMSFGLWVHHMFTVGLPPAVLGLFAAASMVIAFPAGLQTFAWLATLLRAPRIRFTTSMLYILGFLATFVLGGLTGVMVAVVPFDAQVHDTYFVVAHFHYVLVGGVAFPIFAGLYYWWPKIAGSLLSERVGKIAFWLVFIGFNVAFMPQHVAGLMGMPRRVFTYTSDSGLFPWNLASTLGTYLMALGFALHAGSLVWSVWKGKRAPADPWAAPTLEWAVGSDSPPYNHKEVWVVRDKEPLRSGELEPWRPETTRAARSGRVWREQLVTTAFDARPAAVAVVAHDSYMPFLAAVTVSVASAALLFEIYPAALLAGALTVPLVVRWMWPSRAERALEGAGLSLAGTDLPAHTTGARSPAWWAMAFSVGALASALALTVFSHLYLTYGTPGVVDPLRRSLALPLASVVVACAAVVPHWLALRAVRAGRPHALWLFAGAALLAVSVAPLWADLGVAGLRPFERAYDAMFVTFGGYHIVLALIAAAITAFVAVQAALRHFDRRRHGAIENVLMLCGFMAASAAVTVATLYVTPYLFP